MLSGKSGAILLIEDDAVLAMDEQLGLEEIGYRVEVARSAQEALDSIARSQDIDLVLADIDLGEGEDGVETAKHILALRKLPVVFLSSHTDEEIVKRTELLSSFGYVVKNSGLTVLDASIKMARKQFKAQEEALALKDRLQRTLEALPDLLFEVGLDGTLHNCWLPFSQFIPMPARDLIGKRLVDVLPGQVAEIAMSALQEAREKGASFGKQYEMQGPSGRFFFEFSVTYMAGSPESPHFILCSRDISEKKREERRLLDTVALYQQVLDSLPVSVAWKNKFSEYLGCNRSYAEMCGLGRPGEIVEKVNPELHERNSAIEHSARDERLAMEYDSPICHVTDLAFDRNGKTRWLDTSKIPLHDAEGRVSGVLVYFSDITQRRSEEDALLVEHNLLGDLLSTDSSFVYVKDRTCSFIRASRAFVRYLRLEDSSELVGKTDFDFFPEPYARRSYEDEQEILRSGLPSIREEEVEALHCPPLRMLTIKLPLGDGKGMTSGLFCVSTVFDRKEEGPEAAPPAWPAPNRP